MSRIPVYRGYASQYGHGLGNVLGGIVRAALPMMKNVAKNAGKRLLHSGLRYAAQNLGNRVRGRKRKMSSSSAPRVRKAYKRKRPPGTLVRNLKGKEKKKRKKPVKKRRNPFSKDIFT